MSTRRTNRWRGLVAVALLIGATGVIADRPELILLAAVPVAFSAYPWLTPLWEPTLHLERELSEPSPKNGERVTVTTRIRNEGVRPIFDLRLVDGVPAALSVVQGSPRRGAVLWPGREVSFSYEVEAKRGKHHFGPATVAVRDLSGAREYETEITTDTEIDCTTDLTTGPIRPKTLDYVGRVLSEQVGRGIEFDRTREYQRGDEINRIDWNRYARTGQLTTVEFRTERAVTAVVLVDARAAAYRGSPEGLHAVGMCTAAAEQLLVMLLQDRNRGGIAAFGREFFWVAPDTGREHLIDAQRKVGSSTVFSPLAPGETPPVDEQFEELRKRLPDEAQVILLSPLVDDEIVRVSRKLDAYGVPVSVVSPDVTDTETLGRRLVSVERMNRLANLRSAGIPTVDWDPSTPMLSAMTDAQERWSV